MAKKNICSFKIVIVTTENVRRQFETMESNLKSIWIEIDWPIANSVRCKLESVRSVNVLFAIAMDDWTNMNGEFDTTEATIFNDIREFGE